MILVYIINENNGLHKQIPLLKEKHLFYSNNYDLEGARFYGNLVSASFAAHFVIGWLAFKVYRIVTFYGKKFIVYVVILMIII